MTIATLFNGSYSPATGRSPDGVTTTYDFDLFGRPAHPLRTAFHATLAEVQWVSLGYLLALTALLIPVGRLADAHGRKLTYLYGFVVFTAASRIAFMT